jgi:hypothetical protein
MNTRSIDEIEGLTVDSNIFQDFSVKEILQEYDGPLLLVANSLEGENWLFKWCDTLEPSKVDRWIAFKISESRLNSLKNDEFSLREAVSLYEKEQFYVLETFESIFNPLLIKSSFPEKLPIGYLPSDDVSINGKRLSLALHDMESLTVRMHVFSEYISKKTPLSIISRLQNIFQQYMTSVAHAIENQPEEKILPSFKDWTGFNLTKVSKGSFKMECASNSNRKQTEKLAKACELLANLSTNNMADKTELEGLLRSDVLQIVLLLANFVSSLDLSISITWASSDVPNGYLAIDKRRVEAIINYLESIQEDEHVNSITIELSSEEADPLRIPAKGEGGWQNLVRKLKSNLTQENRITLTSKDVERILRYHYLYGQGGFQNQLDGIAVKLKRIGVPFNIL